MKTSGLLDRLAADHRVIAFDRPGFGYTARPRNRIWTAEAQADLIGRALEALGVGPAIVVGHSWGTLVTLALALNRPQAVTRIVLLSGYYFPNLRLDVPLLSGPAIPVVGDVMSHTISPLVARAMTPALVRRIFQPAPVAESFRHFPIELSLRPSQVRASGADTALMIPAAASLSARYGELAMPVTIVAGDGDKIIDCDQAERLHAALPGSKLRLVPGAGHMVHHTAPDAVIAAITE
jgi:pimeloyl-ACP methyl ester carboxylesterase